MLPPFVWLGDTLFIITNWDCSLPGDAWLILRPATAFETRRYRECVDNGLMEAFYTVVLNDADRLVGRRGPAGTERSSRSPPVKGSEVG